VPVRDVIEAPKWSQVPRVVAMGPATAQLQLVKQHSFPEERCKRTPELLADQPVFIGKIDEEVGDTTRHGGPEAGIKGLGPMGDESAEAAGRIPGPRHLQKALHGSVGDRGSRGAHSGNEVHRRPCGTRNPGVVGDRAPTGSQAGVHLVVVVGGQGASGSLDPIDAFANASMHAHARPVQVLASRRHANPIHRGLRPVDHDELARVVVVVADDPPNEEGSASGEHDDCR